MSLKFDKRGWSEVVTHVIDTEGRRQTEAIAAGCNADAGLGDEGYRAGTEGTPGKTLGKDDYRATVITVTEAAKIDNAENNTLVRNLGAGASE